MYAASKSENVIVSIEGTVSFIMREFENYNKVLAVKAENIPDYAKSDKYPNTFVAVGVFYKVAVGQKFYFVGKWENSKFGWRFIVEKCDEIVPKDRNAIIDLLCGTLYKGTGRKTAATIVDTFGETSFDVIKKHPERLMMIKGIPVSKVKLIIDASRESQYFDKLIYSLAPHGITLKQIQKIYDKYGDNAINDIITNPYRLCDDIIGIEFDVCDSIAKACNFVPNNGQRIRAAILHILEFSANGQGHSYLPYEELLKLVKQFLQNSSHMSGRIADNDMAYAIVIMSGEGDIFIDRNQSVYLPKYYSYENYVANKLSILMSSRKKRFRIPFDEAISLIEEKHKIKYSSNQKDAIKQAINNVMVLNGGAGTGKTTLVKALIDIFHMNFSNIKVVLAAPTGRAAQRMTEATGFEAKTVHRILEYRPDTNGCLHFGKNEVYPIDADVIIIDETSMLTLDNLANLLRAVKHDTSVFFVGDFNQLPSVGAGAVLKDIIESQRIPTVFLNEIFRQEGTSRIIINADKICRGDIDLEFGEDFVFIEENDPSAIPSIVVDCFLRELSEVKNINDIMVLSRYRNQTEVGCHNLNKVLQEKLNPASANVREIRHERTKTIFRNHDKVLHTINNYDKNVFNGTIGLIKSVDLNQRKVSVDYGENVVDYYSDELNELQISYASTVHKAQGSETKIIIFPLTYQGCKNLQNCILYTAVTRSREKVYIIGDKKALNYCIRNKTTASRYSNLKNRIIEVFGNK